MITILVEFKFLPEYIEDAKKLTKELGFKSIKEDGCLMYHVKEDFNDPSTVILYEVFKDRDAQDYHKTTEHYIDILLNKLPKMIEKRTVKFLI